MIEGIKTPAGKRIHCGNPEVHKTFACPNFMQFTRRIADTCSWTGVDVAQTPCFTIGMLGQLQRQIHDTVQRAANATGVHMGHVSYLVQQCKGCDPRKFLK